MNQYKYDSAGSSEKSIQTGCSDTVHSPPPNSSNTPKRFKKPPQVYVSTPSTSDTDLPKDSTQEVRGNSNICLTSLLPSFNNSLPGGANADFTIQSQKMVRERSKMIQLSIRKLQIYL